MAVTAQNEERGWRATAAPLVSTAVGAAFGAVLLAAVLSLLLAGAAEAQSIRTRGGAESPAVPSPGAGQAAQAPQTAPAPAAVVPVEFLVLAEAGPLAADGAGRLFMLASQGDGYDLLRLADAGAGVWETVYRRKAQVATSLALGWDGTICIGLLSGIDCIDPSGRVAHYTHELLSGIVSLAIAPDRHLWVLRSAAGGTTGLELVRATPGPSQSLAAVSRVLSLRQSVQGFAGNGLAAATDGSVLLPVIENDTHRVLRVQPGGGFTRVGDFWRLGGGIVLAQGDRMLLGGTKRPQSLEEQRAPVDVIYTQGALGASSIAGEFPKANGSQPRLSGYAALGGDGSLYLIRHQEVRVDDGPPVEAPVLWRAPVGMAPVQGGAKAIAFSIPHIASLARSSPVPAEYAGPLIVARGKELVIEGINFEGKEGARHVQIGEVRARVESWTSDRIVARVPSVLGGGPADVRVGIDLALSDPESFEVKTPDTPGWFQIGSPSTQALLKDNLTISGYTGLVEIVGATESGETVHLQETMETPGLYHVRLPNGLYTAHFKASYLVSQVRWEAGFTFAGAAFVPVQVEEQVALFQITDDEPIAVWMPEML